MKSVPGIPASEYNPATALSFPMFHMRDTFVRASVWNTRIDAIYRFLEAVRHMLIQQQQMQSQNPGADVYTYEEEYTEARRPLEALHALHSQQQQLVPAVAVVSTVGDASASLSPLNEDSPPPPQTRDNSVSGSFSEPFNAVPPNAIPHHHATHGADAAVIATAPGAAKAVVAESKKAADKPADKMSRVAKVISRFLVMGSKEAAEEHGKFHVPLGDFGEGRYGLQPGRRGEVIPVHEDEFATIIAYSLASGEYHDSLKLSLREDNIDNPDYDAAATNFNAYDHDPKKKFSDDPLTKSNTSANAGPALGGKAGGSGKSKAAQQEEDLNDIDNDADEHDLMGSGASTRSHDTSSKLVIGVEASEVERAFATAVKDSEVITSGNLFSASGGSDHLFNKEEDGGGGAENGQETATGDEQTDEEGSDKQQPSNSSRSGEFTGKSTNEKQMISQNKSYIRHRFNDTDEDGNVTCKFQCQIYWAKQFEAVRACYFKEEDNENFIRSLSMSSRWSAQGGKSGAAFSKSMDDRLVIKVISRVELQMFLEFAPAYFGEINCFIPGLCD